MLHWAVPKLTIEVPEELLEFAGGSEQSANQLLLESGVMQLVRLRRISAGKAAELLGISRWDLPDLYTAHQVSAADFSESDLERF